MAVRLPLFPLDVVLFPGIPLPLHIFEPRYRQLLNDCLEDHAPFGIVRLGRKTEAPPPGTVGCAARILAHDSLPDGRSNIVVVGGNRFIVQRYLDDTKPYLVAMVEEFQDRERSGTAPDTTRLRTLFRSYLDAKRLFSDQDDPLQALPDDPVVLTFFIAAVVEVDTAYKLQVLELRSAAERIALLTDLLPALARDLERRAHVQNTARWNGKVHHPPASPS